MSIKVADINKQSPSSRLYSRDIIKSEKESTDSFSIRFKELKGDSTLEKLTNLLNDIDKQTEKFDKNLYLGDLIKYKKLVKDFLDVAVRNSHQFSKESFLDRRGRHRVFSIVRQVDNELENLTQKFLQDEKDRIHILKKVDDIRGLLLDIFM
ncbi:MAG: YaaR family protein [Thermotaleaceae bacterium]